MACTCSQLLQGIPLGTPIRVWIGNPPAPFDGNLGAISGGTFRLDDLFGNPGQFANLCCDNDNIVMISVNV